MVWYPMLGFWNNLTHQGTTFCTLLNYVNLEVLLCELPRQRLSFRFVETTWSLVLLTYLQTCGNCF